MGSHAVVIYILTAATKSSSRSYTAVIIVFVVIVEVAIEAALMVE